MALADRCATSPWRRSCPRSRAPTPRTNLANAYLAREDGEYKPGLDNGYDEDIYRSGYKYQAGDETYEDASFRFAKYLVGDAPARGAPARETKFAMSYSGAENGTGTRSIRTRSITTAATSTPLGRAP